MIRTLLLLIVVLVAVSILFRVPALYPAAEALWHAFVGFARAVFDALAARR